MNITSAAPGPINVWPGDAGIAANPGQQSRLAAASGQSGRGDL